MKMHYLQCFGITSDKGGEAVVIEQNNLTTQEKQAIATKQNKLACIFIEYNAINKTIVLDYNYPHMRSPLCLHGTLAAGYIYFMNNSTLNNISIETKLTHQKITISKHDNNFITIHTKPQQYIKSEIQLSQIASLLNVAESSASAEINCTKLKSLEQPSDLDF